jgi:hypothetical protein
MKRDTARETPISAPPASPDCSAAVGAKSATHERQGAELTPEQRAVDLVCSRAWDRDVGISAGTWANAIAQAIRDAVAAERLACAETVRFACGAYEAIMRRGEPEKGG